MKCPKCDKQMEVTHSYKAGEAAVTQRSQCPACRTICTAVAVHVLVAIDPDRNGSAYSLAKKLKKKPLDRAALSRVQSEITG